MHYALARHKIDAGEYEFEHILQDIESLNRAAAETKYDVTALSIHAYAYLSDKYALLSHGASMGEEYGPMVVAKREYSLEAIKSQVVAIPGKQTSAFLALKLFAPDIATVEMPFDEILPAVANDKVAAGLLIHEGQLTYRDAGTQLVLDLGRWWSAETGGLPLPLGGNAIRRDLPEKTKREVSHLLRESIRYALQHREEALDYAMEFARGLETEREMANRFVRMYVNQRTLDYGDDGRKAVRLFLQKGFEAGLIPHQTDVEFVD